MLSLELKWQSQQSIIGYTIARNPYLVSHRLVTPYFSKAILNLPIGLIRLEKVQ